MPSTLGEEIYGEVDGGKMKLKSREFLTKRFAKTFPDRSSLSYLFRRIQPSGILQACWNKRKRILQLWIRPLSALLSCFPKFKFPISMQKYTRGFFIFAHRIFPDDTRGLSISKGKAVLLQSSTTRLVARAPFDSFRVDYRAWRRGAQGVPR